MRQLSGKNLWLGHAGDARDIRSILQAGILALVDLALNEPPAPVTRELCYCRFPLVDGAGNPSWLLHATIETVASLVRSRIPTLVCCGAGMSRSIVVTAAALASVSGESLERSLELTSRDGPCDVSPALWESVMQACNQSASQVTRSHTPS